MNGRMGVPAYGRMCRRRKELVARSMSLPATQIRWALTHAETPVRRYAHTRLLAPGF